MIPPLTWLITIAPVPAKTAVAAVKRDHEEWRG
jgi:hypothetical protein